MIIGHRWGDWLGAGWKTGAILGGTYGAVYGALASTGFFWFILIGFACGCVIGFFAGRLTLGHGAPIADIALPTAPILAVALCLATTIAPAG